MTDTPHDKTLRRALVNFLGERNEENLFAFFDLLRASTLLSPAQIEGLPQEVQEKLRQGGEVKLQGQLRIKSSCLKIQDKKYLPLFTCRSELEKGPKCNCISVPLRHFLQPLQSDPEIDALIVDPFSKPNLVIPRDKLAGLINGEYRSGVSRKLISADTPVKDPEPFPQELAGSLYVLLDNLEGVERAWLLLLDDPQNRSWLAVVDYHGIRQDTLTAMLTSAAKKHGQGLPLALLPLEGEAAHKLVEGRRPFFVSGEAPRSLLN